ncbi:MAG: response regulator [Deltaproteobacteria bacterium]|nr:response regulator [Deltaproteobacteria bacterium]
MPRDPAESEDRPEEASDKPPSVLLVDDEDRFRTHLAQRLTLRGMQVRHVADGDQALRVARAHRPDVVVLDRKMPKMAGEEVLKRLKRIVPEVQVVMLTGHGSIESASATGKLDAFA